MRTVTSLSVLAVLLLTTYVSSQAFAEEITEEAVTIDLDSIIPISPLGRPVLGSCDCTYTNYNNPQRAVITCTFGTHPTPVSITVNHWVLRDQDCVSEATGPGGPWLWIMVSGRDAARVCGGSGDGWRTTCREVRP